jgi:hypothetical protein
MLQKSRPGRKLVNKMYYQDVPKCYHEIWLKKKTSLRYLPNCDISKKFMRLLKKKEFTREDLLIIESMGYVVEIDRNPIGI